MLSLQGSMGGSTREDNLFALPVYRYWSSVPSWLNQTQQKVWLNMDSTFDLPFTQTQKASKALFARLSLLTIVCCLPGKV